MKCPRCGNRKMFDVVVQAYSTYDAEEDFLGELEFPVIDETADAICKICGYAGSFETFENEGDENGETKNNEMP